MGPEKCTEPYGGSSVGEREGRWVGGSCGVLGHGNTRQPGMRGHLIRALREHRRPGRQGEVVLPGIYRVLRIV